MLHLDCDQRITPRALLEHPFFSLGREIQTDSGSPERTMVQPYSSSPEPTVDQPTISYTEPTMVQPYSSSPERIVDQRCSLPVSHTPSVSEEQRKVSLDTTDSGKG